jgi:hypothetical protein
MVSHPRLLELSCDVIVKCHNHMQSIVKALLKLDIYIYIYISFLTGERLIIQGVAKVACNQCHRLSNDFCVTLYNAQRKHSYLTIMSCNLKSTIQFLSHVPPRLIHIRLLYSCTRSAGALPNMRRLLPGSRTVT